MEQSGIRDMVQAPPDYGPQGPHPGYICYACCYS
jgi:hypothetical protein